MPEFCQAYQSTIVLPQNRINFCQVVKTVRFYKFAGINLTENVDQVNLILLFRVYTFNVIDTYILAFSSAYVAVNFCFQLIL